MSYTIVHYNVIGQLVYYRGPPTAIDAILATIVDGGQAIIVINIATAEIN